MTDSELTEELEKKPIEEEQGNSIVERLSSAEFWLRLVYMLIFFLIIMVASYVVVAVVIAQFFWVLITGEKNINVLRFSKSLSLFIHEILLFLSHNSDEKPFPFKDWPENNE